MKKKKNRRNVNPYPGLVRELNVRTKWDYLDQDYVDKLSDAEKQFLSNFNDEFYGGSFNHAGKKLHRTKKERRECYGRNNARNRDVFAISRATNQLEQIPNDPTPTHLHKYAEIPGGEAQHEDVLLELIDSGQFELTYEKD